MQPDHIEPVFDAARTHAPDRYLASLLCPADERDDLIAMAAVLGEIERIPAMVSEPVLGEIRLQWWADWLASLTAKPDTRTGNPVADALAEVVARRALPIEPLNALCDARIADFYADPFTDEAAYVAYLSACEAGLFELAARICGVDQNALEAREVYDAAGRAYGGIRVLMKLAFFAARGRWPLPLPSDGLDPEAARYITPAPDTPSAPLGSDQTGQAMRQTLVRDEMKRINEAATQVARQIAAFPPRQRAAMRRALRPLALVKPYLRHLDKHEAWALQPMPDLAPLSRVWTLWTAKLIGRP